MALDYALRAPSILILASIAAPAHASETETVTDSVDTQQTHRSVLVDSDKTGRGETLSKAMLARLPIGGAYQRAVDLVAGGVNSQFGGAAYNENTFMLDGVNATDPVTGTFAFNFNYAALQQVNVMLGGHMPEYAGSLGAIINLVTDTGTNELAFETSARYGNGDWGTRSDARYSHDGYELSPGDFDAQSEELHLSGKVSGPVVRDRMWLMFSYQHGRTLIADTGVQTPRDFDGHYLLGKLTAQPTAAHRFTALTQLDPTSIDNNDRSSTFIKPAAQERQYQGGMSNQVRWQWLAAPAVSLDTQLMAQKTFIEIGPASCTHDRSLGYDPCKPDEEAGTVDWHTPGRMGMWGAYSSVSSGYFNLDDRLRYSASTKLTIANITDPADGQHDIKLGAEGVHLIWDQIQGFSGNTQYWDANGVSYDPTTFQNAYWYETTGPIQFRTTGSEWSWFVQDAYKPGSNVMIKGGFRFDHTAMRDALGRPSIVGNTPGPRLYASWDPLGDQKTKIAGGYGRFHDTSRLSVASFTSRRDFGSKLYPGEYWSEFGLGFVNSNDLMLETYDRGQPKRVPDAIKLPAVHELSLIVSREVAPNLGIEVDLAYRQTRNLYEYDETNVIYDEDGSGRIGSRSPGGSPEQHRLRTPTLARRDHVQCDTRLFKVDSRRWFGTLVYTHARSFGTSETALSGAFANAPQTGLTYGSLSGTDVRHVVKGNGSWLLPTDPWTPALGATFAYYSGAPLERHYAIDGSSIRIRPRGSYARAGRHWTAALKLTQDIATRGGVLQAELEVQNMFNNHAPMGVDQAMLDSNNRLLFTSRQEPRRLTAGARYRF
jgi:hypothetical protein